MFEAFDTNIGGSSVCFDSVSGEVCRGGKNCSAKICPGSQLLWASGFILFSSIREYTCEIGTLFEGIIFR